MKATIMVVPKWFPLTNETLRRLVEHKDILNEWSLYQLHNPNIYNIIATQSTRLILESILSRSLEINYKTNYHYCKLMKRIEKIVNSIPKDPVRQASMLGSRRPESNIHADLINHRILFSVETMSEMDKEYLRDRGHSLDDNSRQPTQSYSRGRETALGGWLMKEKVNDPTISRRCHVTPYDDYDWDDTDKEEDDET